MTSERKPEANRRNAQRSTGPKTEAGKRRSSRNAMRHGIFAEKTLREADPELAEGQLRDAFVAELRRDLKPKGAFEEVLVDKLALLYIRLQRLHQLEAALTAKAMDDAVAERRSARKARHGLLETSPGKEPHLGIPPEDLEMYHRLRAEELDAARRPDPLADPSPPVVSILEREAEELRLTVDVSLEDLLDAETNPEAFEHVRDSEEALRKLWEEICQARRLSATAAWEQVRSDLEQQVRYLDWLIRTVREEDSVARSLAALPPEGALDRVIRYEAHLERAIYRTMEQFKQRRLIRGGLDP
jgi:hypothetical protein